MSFLSNVFKFEKHNFGYMLDGIKEDPERILIGAADPFSTKVWNKVLGKDYKPLVDQWGGASEESYKQAEEKGIDTKAGGAVHSVARVIAAIFAMNAAGSAMGGGAEAAGGAADAAAGGGAEAVGGVGGGAAGAGEAAATGISAEGGAAAASGAGGSSAAPSAGAGEAAAGGGSAGSAAGGGAEAVGGVPGAGGGSSPGLLGKAAGWFKDLPPAAQYGVIQTGASAVQAAFTPSAEEEAQARAEQERESLAHRIQLNNQNTNVGNINVGRASGQPLRNSNGELVYPVSRTGFVRDERGNLIPQEVSPRGFIEDAMSTR
jgi:hypothetical protein